MREQASKILLVEGIDDQKVIEKLLKRRKIGFDDFAIHNCEGLDKLLNVLPTKIVTGSSDEVIGVIADADENPAARWQTVRKLLIRAGYENIPNDPDPRGMIVKDEDEELPRLGIWLMPDNQAKGTIEDFIRFLIPDGDDMLPLAQKKIEKLIREGQNRFNLTQKSKALIHTWLAWQERPGKQLGSAVTYRMVTTEYLLDDGKASYFVDWLKKLFR